ncbi:MAG: alpha/beta hydrolase [Bacteroidetes bacterium]|nr:alpha/beta hydrolase [Bacteroidota bacterium]
MNKFIGLLTFVILSTGLYAQQSEKIYLNKADSTRNCYTAITPPKQPWKGLLVLLPGFGEDAERVMQQTNLPKTAARNGLLTVIPTLQDGPLSFTTDSISQLTLQTIIDHVHSKYKIAGLPFYIGGYSMGGSAAIMYAENASKKPAAVFALDPPLDFEHFYNAAVRDIRISVNRAPHSESQYMIDRLKAITGGTPADTLSAYRKISPYSFTDTTQTAIKKLVHVPVRIYAEADVRWWLDERGFDLTNTNITECSAMINELQRLGNTKAELVVTVNKGYRKPGNIRHPHSWSIADSNELVKWLLTHN